MIKSLIILLFLTASLASAKSGYYRSPALHKDTLVFTAEGDLWVTTLDTGKAQRLTTHPAEELGAAISPDGKLMAYEANYVGAKEVYVIPLSGGVAKRISYEGSDVKVQGWSMNGDVIYSHRSRVGAPGNWSLVTVNPETLKTTPIPLSDAINGAIDKSGENIYFTRFGLQVSTDNVKVYRGGAKGKLWHFKLDSGEEATQLVKEHIGSIRGPMVFENKLYFISDASGTDNIWSMSLENNETEQLTTYTNWEVRSASLSEGKIAYQHGADIKIMNLTDKSIRSVKLNLISDFPHLREHWENKPLTYLNSANLAPNNEKVVLTARGRVAVAGLDQSRLVEINTGDDSRVRQATLSHDGKWVYAISDASGEHEIWKYAADGSAQAEQLTDDGEIFRWNLALSPDGKWLAHDDKLGRLFLMNLTDGENKEILSDNVGLGAFANVTWSPDSQLIAVTRNHINDVRSRIQLYAINNGRTEVLTSDKYNSFSPVFSPDGDWLYFLSDRHFSASPGGPWGDRNTGSTFDRRTEVYAIALHDKAQFPFQIPNELTPKDDKTDRKKSKNNEKGTKGNQSHITWSGLADRLWQVPVEPGNYTKLLATKKFIYLKDQSSEPNSKPVIKSVEAHWQPKVTQFTDAVEDFQLSNDGKKMFIKKQGGENAHMFIVAAGGSFPKDAKGTQVITKDWQMLLDPRQEWEQLFHDTWLMHRDSLFDPNMRGLDWPKIERKYAPLLERITDRFELNDVLSQMVGELNTMHSQVRGGDVPVDSDSAKTALLGASMKQTEKGVLIQQIYQHDTELPGESSPLARPGVDVKNGDLIVAINGVKTATLASVWMQLRNQVGKQVLLQIKRGKSRHQTVVTPVSTREDSRLRYKHWVESNRRAVVARELDIGYLHLYAMGGSDFGHFAREFYANYKKSGLIIDVRRNRGGNIDSLIIEKLLRRKWMFWQTTRGVNFGNMQQTFGGHLVVLADEYTYSDGETFTAGVKSLKLGTVIGKQTAGAGVWLSDFNRVADKGISRVAEYPVFNTEGQWVVEGYGVTPHIEVTNLPHATFNGEDAQLEAAIKFLENKITTEPIKDFKAEPFPGVDTPAIDVN